MMDKGEWQFRSTAEIIRVQSYTLTDGMESMAMILSGMKMEKSLIGLLVS